MTSDELARLIETHRLEWPVERVRSDPDGFLAASQAILDLASTRTSVLADPWPDLLFGQTEQSWSAA